MSISLCLFSIISIKGLLSKVIISKPFFVSADDVSQKIADSIKIHGYSMLGTDNQLKRIDGLNKWKFSDYSVFTSLFISSGNTNCYIPKLKFQCGERTVYVYDIFLSSNTEINLSEYLKMDFSVKELLICIYYWEGLVFIITGVFLLILVFIAIFFSFKKNRTINTSKKVLIGFFLLGFLLHIVFLIFSGFYFITFGFFTIVIIAWIISTLLKLFANYGNFKLKIREPLVIMYSVTFVFCFIEIIFLISGYKITNLERRYKYFYSSRYIPPYGKRYHSWNADHKLKTNEYCYYRTINSEMLSDKEHSELKENNEYRIIGLGDSFTEGDGADADSTWLKFLERSIKKHSIKKEITFFNAGICGSDPFFEYILLKEKLLKYNPDLVIVCINISDISDILVRGGIERFQSNGTVKFKKPPWWEPIYATLRISRLIFDNLLGYNELLQKESESNYEASKKKILEAIYLFDNLANMENYKLLVVFNPMKNEIDEGKSAFSDEISKINKNTNIEVLDLLEFYKTLKINSSNSNKYFWKYDGHHNAKGYEIFAKGVVWKLNEMGIIDSLKKK